MSKVADNASMPIQWTSGQFGAPTYATEGSACVDFIAAMDATILPLWLTPLLCGALKPQKIATGVRWEPNEEDLYMEIKSRSSLACEHAIHVVAGVIDADYRGEIIVCLENRGFLPYYVKAGQRIAQGLIGRRVTGCAQTRANARPRLDGGFGSTDAADDAVDNAECTTQATTQGTTTVDAEEVLVGAADISDAETPGKKE